MKSRAFTALFACILFVLSFFVVARSLTADEQNVPSPQQLIEQAWQQAQESGAYRYHSDVQQRIYPAPRLENVGKQPQEEIALVNGRINLHQETMEMTIWQQENAVPEAGLSVRIEDGQAYGRSAADTEWQPLDAVPTIFAPNSDPLGFLVSATQIAEIGTETRQLGDVTLTFTRYSFELDSDAYANQMQKEMESHLRQFGSLPAGLRLETAEFYRQAAGAGEIWLDEQGLPARLTMQLTLPPEGENGKTVADITTDFSDFDQTYLTQTAVSFWASPLVWFNQTVPPSALAQLASQLIIAFAILAVVVISIKHWHAYRFYAGVSLFIILSMLLTPLLQGHQVHAFMQNLDEYLQANEARPVQAEAVTAATEWNPHQDPFSSNVFEKAGEAEPLLSAPQSELQGVAAQTTALIDSDGDGIDDDTEDEITTDPNDSDSDDDGLDDGVEYNTLGTDPRMADHDGDGISDLDEVTPFEYNGQTWYMNPLQADTNGDSLIDSIECFERSALADSPDGTAVCPDTDNDGTPDLFDDDNDGDGIHDSVDLSPLTALGVFNDSNPFALTVNNLQTDLPVFVTLQIRPTNEKHLTYFGNVLDWPTGDDDGQIQRHLDTTFADTAVTDIQSSDSNAAFGDMRLTPVVEIYIPYEEGHYGNLPVLEGAPARTAALALDEWLDTTELDRYGISVHQVDETSGDLIAYLPLTVSEDETGGGLDAFSTQMVYWPSQSDWGSAQEMRLLWMVQKIADECTSTDDATGECLLYEDTGIEVIHIYDDDWTMTGMEVKEDHGMEIAIVAEDPALDGDLDTDGPLWQLGHNLSLTFTEGADCVPLEGETTCTRDDEREITVAEIYNRWNHATNDVYTDSERWNIADTLVVSQTTYTHSGYVALLATEDTPNFLDSVFAGYETLTNPTLLFAQEETARSTNLADATDAGGSYVIDFSTSAPAVETIASLKWAPYDYDSVSGWENYDIDSYLDYLKLRLADHTEFQPEDSTDESAEVVEGQLFAAQMVYLTLYNGVSAQVEYDGFPVETDDGAFDLYTADVSYDWQFLAPVREVAKLYIYRSLATRVAPAAKEVKSFWTALGKWQWGNYVRTTIHNGTDTTRTFKNINLLADLPQGNIGKAGVALAGMAVVGFTLAALVGSDCDSVSDCDAIAIATAGASAAMTTVEAVNMVNKLVKGYQSVSGFSNKITKMTQLTKHFDFASAAGLILELVVIWTLFALSGASMVAAAFAIASTVVALIMFAIGFIPVIGQLFLLLIALVDALSYIICEAFGLSGSGCDGATGNLTAVIADWLYDVNEVIDLDDPDRFEITYDDVSLTDMDAGYTSANSIDVSISITNTVADSKFLYTYEMDPDTHVVGDLLTQDVTDYTRATFEYLIQTTETDHHSDLDLRDMEDDWQIEVTREITAANFTALTQFGNIYYTESLSDTVDLAGVGVGINRNLGPLYLSESAASPYQECLAGICEWRSTKFTAHYEIGEALVFDILPPTLDGFYELANNASGFALAWADSAELEFPRLMDADGDGLINTTDGGTDSNDSDWDRDDDGLSDIFELEEGTSPSQADTDGDGLDDATELYLGTNPRLADSDDDGLRDDDELAGWLIRYGTDIDGVTPLYSKVWSDPLVADSDEDGLNDYEEFILGLHPGIEDDIDVQDSLAFSDAELNEVDTPVLLLRFEEEDDGTVLFHDESGNNYAASCEEATCPSYGMLGKYGTAVSLDGSSQYLELTDSDDLEMGDSSFTVAAWVKANAFTDWHNIVSDKYENNSSGWVLRVNPSGIAQFVFNNGSSSWLASAGTLSTNTWHHVAAAVDLDTNEIDLYLDGTLVNTEAGISGSAISSQAVTIGRWGDPSNQDFFDGMIDEVVLYDHALSSSEMIDLMNGRYNPNDLQVQPGAKLAHQVTVTNTLGSNHVGVTLFAEAEAPLTLNGVPQTSSVAPWSTETLNETVQVPNSSAAGIYAVNTVAEGAILSSDESTTFRTFPKATLSSNFEKNEEDADSYNYMRLSAEEGSTAIADCERLDWYGFSPDCPTLVEASGINGRGFSFNGSSEYLNYYGTEMGLLNGTPLSLAGWVYPTHDASETEKRGIFGFYEPGETWFRFEETSSSNGFTDEINDKTFTCVNTCPTAGQTGYFGNAAYFTDDRIVMQPVIDSGVGNNFSDLTASFWFKRSNINQQETLFTMSDGTYLFTLGTGPGNIMEIHTSSNGSTPTVLGFPASINNTEWHHIYIEADHNTVIYVDGVEQYEIDEDIYMGLSVDWAQDTEVYLGGTESSSDFDGYIDEFMISDYRATLPWFEKADLMEYGFRTFPGLYAQGESLGFWAMPEGHQSSFEVTTVGLELNRWNHVAYTYDGANSYTLYLNGVAVQEFTGAAVYMPMIHDYGTVARLGWIGGDFDFFQGEADAFKLYDQELSAEEIASLATNTFNESLYAHVDFEEVPASPEFQFDPFSGDAGTCYSDCPTFGARGVVNRAAYFDGDDTLAFTSYVNPTFSSSWSAFSMSAWIKTSSDGTILYYWNDSSGDDHFVITTDRFSMQGLDGSFVNFTNQLPTDSWAHLIAVWEPNISTLQDELRIYINGVEVASQLVDREYGVASTNNPPFYIGGRPDGTQSFTGYMDDLRIYPMPLTDADVLDIYTRSAPVLNLQFDEDSGATTLADASPSGYDATSGAESGLPGRIGNSIYFEEGYVTVPNATALDNITDTLALVAWVNPSDLSGVQRLIGHGSANDGSLDEGSGLRPSGQCLLLCEWRTAGHCQHGGCAGRQQQRRCLPHWLGRRSRRGHGALAAILRPD